MITVFDLRRMLDRYPHYAAIVLIHHTEDGRTVASDLQELCLTYYQSTDLSAGIIGPPQPYGSVLAVACWPAALPPRVDGPHAGPNDPGRPGALRAGGNPR